MAHYSSARMAPSPVYDHPHPCEICGPGGNSTLIENNEDGIQHMYVTHCMQGHQQAELRSNHDSYKQGIYKSNSIGDND